MKYGVILPIWQLSVRDAETLAAKVASLHLPGVRSIDLLVLGRIAAG